MLSRALDKLVGATVAEPWCPFLPGKGNWCPACGLAYWHRDAEDYMRSLFTQAPRNEVSAAPSVSMLAKDQEQAMDVVPRCCPPAAFQAAAKTFPDAPHIAAPQQAPTADEGEGGAGPRCLL